MLRVAIRSAAFLLACVVPVFSQDPLQTGPVALIIQYKCLPAHRADFRQRLKSEALPRFAERQTNGMLAEYHLLFSRYMDTNSWDALALLTFRNYEQATHWKRVEQDTPAGLPSATIALTSSVETYPADIMRQAFSGEQNPHPVYLVVPYTLSVPAAAYLNHADAYAIPQCNGWMQEGVLSGYHLYMQRYTAARPWDTLVVLQYKDDDSFGRRESVAAKVRAQLESNPDWKAASDSQQDVRVEKVAMIADDLALEH